MPSAWARAERPWPFLCWAILPAPTRALAPVPQVGIRAAPAGRSRARCSRACSRFRARARARARSRARCARARSGCARAGARARCARAGARARCSCPVPVTASGSPPIPLRPQAKIRTTTGILRSPPRGRRQHR
ncbi:hypothetical protein DKT68_12270 [Micromonospora acroterricola]|uniref:Uncharacterized protein n=1 Tax=Micromonospora acroterricola TaxID=2202421 RepID=A0A317D9Q2_9ACTN|nr:hypothetical protein DKT68_12270 [Micromonospora acroterricola]